MTAPSAVGAAVEMGALPSSGPTLNRFHIATLCFQRARQLQAGARPRVEDSDHRPTRLALLEVLADTISWTIAAAPPALAPR
jgi:DNA-directed RNA polymerase subunit K/omega